MSGLVLWLSPELEQQSHKGSTILSKMDGSITSVAGLVVKESLLAETLEIRPQNRYLAHFPFTKEQ